MYKILIVEDDINISEMVTDYLSGEGYEVLPVYTGESAISALEQESYDLALIDLMLPGCSGFDVVKTRGLNLGADDYVTKPFSIIELVARIKANIRRATKYINVSHEEEIIQIKDLKIYTDQHKVERGGKIINLTHTEFEILVLLASNPGRAFSKEEMYLKIWNEPYYGNERVLNSHMNRLRGKLNIDNSNKMDYIQTLWGIGYKMEK